MIEAIQARAPRGSVRLDVERLDLTAGGSFVIEGRWYGVRGRRFVRPALTLAADGERCRLLADVEHKPWAADEGELWLAAFPWTLDPSSQITDLELTVAPDIIVVLAPPTTGAAAVDSNRPGRPEPDPTVLRRQLSGARRQLTAERERGDRLDADLEQARAGNLREAEALTRRASLASKQIAELAAARDGAHAAHQAALAERDTARAEQAEATAQRDRALSQRRTALAQRDLARNDRDTVIVQRDAAVAQRHSAITERDHALEVVRQLTTERDDAIGGRNQAIANRDQAIAARDEAISARDRASGERDRAVDERDQAIAAREHARHAARQLTTERDAAIAGRGKAIFQEDQTRRPACQIASELDELQRRTSVGEPVRVPAAGRSSATTLARRPLARTARHRSDALAFHREWLPRIAAVALLIAVALVLLSIIVDLIRP